ncbi:MAG: YajQ family cyclic di-GMP-binding protein [Gammaproteobacteria bacterium]|nr:YajQ family cyclic di-GMP-binding protein [Gammaproteobacteria bacterium]
MPSFDIVSEVDQHEVANAVDQTSREVATRFDFKGTDTRIEHKDAAITIHAENEFQIKQVVDILHQKMAKRGIDIAALSQGKIETTINKSMLIITVQQGIDQDAARKLVKDIKASKIKVQSSIQGDRVRVSGKNRDDLQNIIKSLDDFEVKLPLQTINFRD